VLPFQKFCSNCGREIDWASLHSEDAKPVQCASVNKDKRSIEEQNKSADELFQRADKLYNNHRYEEAMQVFENARQIYETTKSSACAYSALVNKGACLFYLNRLDEAFECFKEAVAYPDSKAMEWLILVNSRRPARRLTEIEDQSLSSGDHGRGWWVKDENEKRREIDRVEKMLEFLKESNDELVTEAYDGILGDLAHLAEDIRKISLHEPAELLTVPDERVQILCFVCEGKGGRWIPPRTEVKEYKIGAHWDSETYPRAFDRYNIGDHYNPESVIRETIQVPGRNELCFECNGAGRLHIDPEDFVRVNDYLSSYNSKINMAKLKIGLFEEKLNDLKEKIYSKDWRGAKKKKNVETTDPSKRFIEQCDTGGRPFFMAVLDSAKKNSFDFRFTEEIPTEFKIFTIYNKFIGEEPLITISSDMHVFFVLWRPSARTLKKEIIEKFTCGGAFTLKNAYDDQPHPYYYLSHLDFKLDGQIPSWQVEQLTELITSLAREHYFPKS
jgi:tetratricopeptide (TPR) repeat protein